MKNYILFFLTILLSLSLTAPLLSKDSPEISTRKGYDFQLYTIQVAEEHTAEYIEWGTPTSIQPDFIFDEAIEREQEEYALDVCWAEGIAFIASREVYQWYPIAERVAEEYEDIDAYTILGVIGKESNGNPSLVSTDGHASVGLMQVIPGRWGRPPASYLMVPENSISYGALLLSETIAHYDGSVYDGLAAYNCGYASYDAGKCFWFGGGAYAQDILDCWIPTIKAYEQLYITNSNQP